MILQRINTALVVLLGLLTIGLALPTIIRARRLDDRTKTINNLKTVGRATHAWHESFKRLPPAFDRAPEGKASSEPAISYPVSLHVHLLPYVDQQAVFKTYLTEGQGQAAAVVPTFIDLLDGTLGPHEGVQNFAANLRVFSTKGARTLAAMDMPPLAKVEPGVWTLVGITNGTSNTIAFATKLGNCGEGGSRYAADPTSVYGAFFGQNAAITTAQYSNPKSTFQWAPRGNECQCQPLMAQTYLPQPLLACMADATVRAMPGGLDPGIWNHMLHPYDQGWTP